jgi:NAD+ diphosphatase
MGQNSPTDSALPHMEMNFCRRCGQKLTNVEAHIYTCSSGHTIFANCTPSVGVFLITPDNNVILSVRGIDPHKGMLDTLGGFLDGEETLEAAATRELREEAHLEPMDYEPLRYLTSGLGNYPYQGEQLPVLTVLYWTRLISDKPLQSYDDVAGFKTLRLDEIKLATVHDEDIRVGVRALQKLFTTDTTADKE